MAVMRVHKTKDYTVMSNTHFREREMSLKAKGLLSLMFSLPDNWDYSVAGLVAICKENETAINSTLKELKKFGYLSVTKLMPNETESGRIEYVYDIYETPAKIENLPIEKQGVENQGVVFQEVENPVQLSTYKSNTNKSITKKSNTNKSARFVKPTLEEIQAYCTERNNNVDAERFYDYYEANGWKVGKNPMKDWKASVRTWERNGYDSKPIAQKASGSIMDDYRAMEERINTKGLFG